MGSIKQNYLPKHSAFTKFIYTLSYEIEILSFDCFKDFTIFFFASSSQPIDIAFYIEIDVPFKLFFHKIIHVLIKTRNNFNELIRSRRISIFALAPGITVVRVVYFDVVLFVKTAVPIAVCAYASVMVIDTVLSDAVPAVPELI